MSKLLSVALAFLAMPCPAQNTGRTMQLLAPPLLGQTATFRMTHPAAAAGNLYAFLWSSPPFVGTTTINVSGLTVRGVAHINPNSFVSAFSGLLDASGTVSHSVAVPNAASFLGYAWDLQSIDLAVAAGELLLADNELSLFVLSSNMPSNMVTIAPGTFQMGSNAASGAPYYGQAGERPVHQATISRPFAIGKYEVTQADYQGLMGFNPSLIPGSNRPVENVSWNDAMVYCAALTAREAAAGRLPTGYQYRLPTEAEWEYCCRAGTTTEFHYGNSLFCGQAKFWFSYHSNSSCGWTGTAVVGGYAANAWGLFDMHGNVWEWCLDSWDGSANYPASLVVDPYVNSGPNRVFRGGGWSSNSNNCRSAVRVGDVPTFRHDFVGFRVVLAPVLVP